MTEKKMTLEELVRWLEDHGAPYEIDEAGRLAVKDALLLDFTVWVRARKYTSLPDELFRVEGSLWLGGTSVTSLGNLTSVGGDFDLLCTPIASLGSLTSVGGWLYLRGTPITSLGNLTHVGGDLDLWGTSVTSLGDLPQIDGNLFLSQNQLHLLTREALRKVGREILYGESSGSNWIPLSPSELEAIITENEARESLQNTKETGVDWDLYDR